GARTARLAPPAERGAAGAVRVHLRAPRTPERGWLSADGRAGWRDSGLFVPDQQPCAAPLVRLQAGERRAGHPVDSALPWAPLDCIDSSLHDARARSVQGFLARLTRPSHYAPLPCNDSAESTGAVIKPRGYPLA